MSNEDTSMPSKDELYEFIGKHEGIKQYAYIDSKGYMTVGIGFNLERKDAREKIEKLKLDYDAIYCREQKINEPEIKKLFHETLTEAIESAKSFVNNFDELPHDMKMVLIDMAFNLGRNGLSKFVNFKTAVENKSYELAAIEMKNSKWYRQVKGRGEELVNIVLGLN